MRVGVETMKWVERMAESQRSELEVAVLSNDRWRWQWPLSPEQVESLRLNGGGHGIKPRAQGVGVR